MTFCNWTFRFQPHVLCPVRKARRSLSGSVTGSRTNYSLKIGFFREEKPLKWVLTYFTFFYQVTYAFYRRLFCKTHPLLFFWVTKALLYSLRAKLKAASLNLMAILERLTDLQNIFSWILRDIQRGFSFVIVESTAQIAYDAKIRRYLCLHVELIFDFEYSCRTCRFSFFFARPDDIGFHPGSNFSFQETI